MAGTRVLDNVDCGLQDRVVKRCRHCSARVVRARLERIVRAAQLAANDWSAEFPVGHLQYGVAEIFKFFGDEATNGVYSAPWLSSQDDDVDSSGRPS